MNTLIIFSLLVVLMITGMPIRIALGLTVLTFLFTMTQVPIESVALKLFTGIEKFEIMAIPFFILAGNFLTHGGVARRMIHFTTSLIGHWYGGMGLAGFERTHVLPSMSDLTDAALNGGLKSGIWFASTTTTSRVVGGLGICARFGIGSGMHDALPLEGMLGIVMPMLAAIAIASCMRGSGTARLPSAPAVTTGSSPGAQA